VGGAPPGQFASTLQLRASNPIMLLGRILGSAVCTLKYPDLEGVKLLTVQPLNKKLEPVGRVQVAADVVDAGPGDLVVMVRSREASLALPGVRFVPVDLACVGVVDELEVKTEGWEFDYQPGQTRYT
jgi:ethanolamine utilization protein EutN